MTRGKIAFCFPGQGSLEQGMGRDIAEAVPEAMRVFELGSEASGLDLRALCFDSDLDELVETDVQQPALVATSLAVLAALKARGIEPDYVVGHSVGEFAALAAASSIGVSETIAPRSRARPRDGRGGARASRARWPRSSGSTTTSSSGSAAASAACGRRTTTARGSSSSRARATRSTSAARGPRRQGARRTVKLRVSGAFHSPLVARAAERLRPAVDKVRFGEPMAPFMSTVTARLESAPRIAPLLVDQLTAPVRFTQAASELVTEGARTFVEVGPGNVLSGLVKRIDRGVKAIPVNSLAALERDRRGAGSCLTWTASQSSTASGRSSPAAREASAARSRSSSPGPAPRSSSATAPGKDEAEAVAKEIGGRAAPGRRVGRRGGGRGSSRRQVTSTSSSTTQG